MLWYFCLFLIMVCVVMVMIGIWMLVECNFFVVVYLFMIGIVMFIKMVERDGFVFKFKFCLLFVVMMMCVLVCFKIVWIKYCDVVIFLMIRICGELVNVSSLDVVLRDFGWCLVCLFWIVCKLIVFCFLLRFDLLWREMVVMNWFFVFGLLLMKILFLREWVILWLIVRFSLVLLKCWVIFEFVCVKGLKIDLSMCLGILIFELMILIVSDLMFMLWEMVIVICLCLVNLIEFLIKLRRSWCKWFLL